MIDINEIDKRALPPLNRMLSHSERVACFRFLRSLAMEIDATIRRLEQHNQGPGKYAISAMIRSWRGQLAGVRLAMHRTGVRED